MLLPSSLNYQLNRQAGKKPIRPPQKRVGREKLDALKESARFPARPGRGLLRPDLRREERQRPVDFS
jgi:hypothetical protein